METQPTETSMRNQIQNILPKKLRLLKRNNKIQTSCINMVHMILFLETTYKNDFIKKDTPVCPAKVFLESKGKDLFSGTKSNFN